ncbi:protein phosphatase PTC7 homolog [Watersipora subatra]|uniref:protein phosphatase PTC7 homolog n=1 Tax=Watersipora subatra TaxID=2589382 RepID=UPI00355C6BF9
MYQQMNSLLTYGKVLVSRALTAGLSCAEARFSSHIPSNAVLTRRDLHLLTAVSGFSKSLNSIGRQSKWSYGEDAYFIARHPNGTIMGVADGVGGWREYGVDPSQVPRTIMASCSRLVEVGRFKSNDPSKLLEEAYEESAMHKNAAMGSTTACIVSLDTADGQLHTVNLGDSGYLVVRDGKILERSQEQQHYFNTPFQLTLVPPSFRGRVLSDSPSEAVKGCVDVTEGDIILVATDGLFDNMTDSMILRHLQIVKHKQLDTIQSAANKIASEARKLSNDPEYESPFCKNAAKEGIAFKGGKPDDITVLIATVNSGEFGEFAA